MTERAKLLMSHDPSRGMVLFMELLKKSKRKCLAATNEGVDFWKAHLFCSL